MSDPKKPQDDKPVPPGQQPGANPGHGGTPPGQQKPATKPVEPEEPLQPQPKK